MIKEKHTNTKFRKISKNEFLHMNPVACTAIHKGGSKKGKEALSSSNFQGGGGVEIPYSPLPRTTE